MIRRSYSATITSTAHLVLAVICVVMLNTLILTLADVALWPVCAAATVVIVASGLYQGVVSLVVSPEVVIVGRGPWRWPARRISTTDVVSAESATISWPQVFGIGTAFRWRMTRLTVRPGPTLCLQLTGGERVWISTSHPDVAREALRLIPSAEGSGSRPSTTTTDTPHDTPQGAPRD